MNSIFLDLGILQIYWYSVFIFLGLLIGGIIVLWEAKRFGISEDFMINMFFYMIPISLIGARLYYVLFNLDYYKVNVAEIFQVWNGGLAIHGAIIFGVIWIIFYCNKYKARSLKILDMIAVGLLIGQSIGRWGNFFNQEAFGSVVSLKFLQTIQLPKFIIDGMLINGAYHHPTFLYESIWTLIGFIAILFIRRFKYIKVGQPLSLYLIWYGFGRFLIEMLRTDSLMFMDFKVAQIVSLLMIAAGLFIFFKKRKGFVFDEQYNKAEETDGIRF